MIFWLSVAFAQSPDPNDIYNYNTSGDWRDCQNHSSIAGTAGFENARSANETNALAYGAVRFAQQELNQMLKNAEERAKSTGKWRGSMANDYHLAFGATHVPTVEGGYPFGGCPSNLRISNRPLDLGGVRIGLAASNGTLGLFYSGSINYGITPSEDGRERSLYHMTGFMYGSLAAALAPLAGKNQEFGKGASAVQTDFVLGATYNPGWARAKVGWVGSQGVFADVEGQVPIFAAAVLKKLGVNGNLIEGGLRKLKTPGGLTSAYAKNQPFAALPSLSSNGTSNPRNDSPSLDFTTGHIEQYDIADIFDIRGSYAIRPKPALHEGTVAIHSRKFWGAEHSEGTFRYLARAGVVQLPDMWYYGVGGGMRPTVHLEAGTFYAGDDSSYKVAAVLDYNSPEQLVLFPFAVNAVFAGYSIQGSF